MANPRQRRKARSSSHKTVSHSLHAKRNLKKMPPVRGPKILQEAWDKTKTVRQNYAALGLVSSLNPLQSGGLDKELTAVDTAGHGAPPDIPSTAEAGPSHTFAATSSAIPKGRGRLIRGEDGKIIGVELPEEKDTEEPEETSSIMKDVEIDPAVARHWVHKLGHQTTEAVRKSDTSTDVVSALASLSSTASPIPRFTSSGERDYLERLVGKHGSDTQAMARDRRLNPEQKTAGELRRAIRKAGVGGSGVS